MRFILSLFVVLLAAPAHAQSPVAAYLDAPAAGQAATPEAVFGGWAVNLRTGRHIASVQLWRLDEASGVIVQVPADVHWGPRPDVQAYARWLGVPYAELALGFSVVPRAPLEPGRWRFVLLLTDMQAHPDAINWTAALERVVTVR